MDPRVEAFKKLSAAAVSDALDHLGLHGACLGIAPCSGDAAPTASLKGGDDDANEGT